MAPARTINVTKGKRAGNNAAATDIMNFPLLFFIAVFSALISTHSESMGVS
jgi:hypothetical protein